MAYRRTTSKSRGRRSMGGRSGSGSDRSYSAGTRKRTGTTRRSTGRASSRPQTLKLVIETVQASPVARPEMAAMPTETKGRKTHF